MEIPERGPLVCPHCLTVHSQRSRYDRQACHCPHCHVNFLAPDHNYQPVPSVTVTLLQMAGMTFLLILIAITLISVI